MELVDIECEAITKIAWLPEYHLRIYGTSDGRLIVFRNMPIEPEDSDSRKPWAGKGKGVIWPLMVSGGGIETEEINPVVVAIPDKESSTVTNLRVGFGPRSKQWVLWDVSTRAMHRFEEGVNE